MKYQFTRGRLLATSMIVGVASLRDAAIWHGGEFEPEPVDPIPGPVLAAQAEDVSDLADVVGNEDAVEAMLVAAAGGHHVFLLGPPGAGKTMLAARLPRLLPELDAEAADTLALDQLPFPIALDPAPPTVPMQLDPLPDPEGPELEAERRRAEIEALAERDPQKTAEYLRSLMEDRAGV